MGRNLLALILSIAAMFGLFWGYLNFIKMPVPTGHSASDNAALPRPRAAGEGEVIRIQSGVGGTLPPGGETGFTVYDPKSGRATSHFQCQEWRKVAGSLNQVEVVQPVLNVQMPSGVVAAISAARGQITTDRLESKHINPKQGELTGGVRIVLTRETSDPGSTEKTETSIAITTEQVEFDMDLGELRTEHKLSLAGEDVELSGTGLHLIWNQADNRLEQLSITRGERLALQVSSDLFGGLKSDEQDSASPTNTKLGASSKKNPKGAASAPSSAPAASRPARAGTAYACKLTGDIRVQHFRGDQEIGGLTADEVNLLFDVGGNAGDFLGGRRATSKPSAKGDRLELHWSGPLELAPGAALGGARRRHFEALGRDVLIKLPQGDVHCARLNYHDETQQLWLYPQPGQALDMVLSERLAVKTTSVFIDRQADLVKLMGPVELRSRAKAPSARPGKPTQTVSLSSSLWAELHLEHSPTSTTADTADLFTPGALKSAVFAGDVAVQIGSRKLLASRLEATFRAAPAEKRDAKRATSRAAEPDLLLDTTIASGAVSTTAGSAVLNCAEMTMWYTTDAHGDPTPLRVHAVGAVDLQDPQKHVSAAGQRLEADFDPNQQIRHAVVFGSTDHHARVYSRPYAVRGPKIELDPLAQSLHVAGRSRLSFRSLRGLRGETYSQPTPIVIRSSQDMSASGTTNLIEFVGDVDAQSGEEHLVADSLTMTLADVKTPSTAPSAQHVLGQWWNQARGLLLGRRPEPPAPDLAGPTAGRKEPVQAVARNVTVYTQRRDADGQVVLHESMTAPEMQMDIQARRVRTVGRTLLGMENLNLGPLEKARSSDLGLPSALISNGPSQTALECEKSMIYVIGEEGPQRRDTVLFDGGVKMVQVAGKEIPDLERVLPKLRGNPELISKLKSRNVVMTADQLEVEFASGPPKPNQVGTGGMSVRWLNALGNVNFRDQQGPKLRSVYAQQAQFDRDANVVRILGSPHADARVYDENVDTGQLSAPAVGPEFTIFLDNNTVKTGRVGGEFRRPRD